MTGASGNATLMGTVIGGSLSRGIEVRLDGSFPVESVTAGGFVTIQGRDQRFFGIVTDVALESSDSSLRAAPPDASDPFVASVISGTGAYAVVTVLPQLTLGIDPFALV
ncbi:MAG: HAS-barrel domain-containing protein, partial [Dehalococcoidia bacterium]